MSHLLWLTQEQVELLRPFFPKERGVERADDRKVLYKMRHKVENLFAKLKDWRRIATRYNRCAHTFRSAIYITATVIFWYES